MRRWRRMSSLPAGTFHWQATYLAALDNQRHPLSALTKILIVLQLVFSLVCSVLLVLMVSRMENYKSTAAIADTRAIATAATLTKTQAEKEAALGRIADLTGQLN